LATPRPRRRSAQGIYPSWMDCPRWLSPWQSLPYQKRGLTLAQCSVALAVRYMCYLCTSAFSRSPCVRRPCTLASEMWRAWSLASPSSWASLFDRTCTRHAVQPCWPPQVALRAHLLRGMRPAQRGSPPDVREDPRWLQLGLACALGFTRHGL
jgi:hypothetical protein